MDFLHIVFGLRVGGSRKDRTAVGANPEKPRQQGRLSERREGNKLERANLKRSNPVAAGSWCRYIAGTLCGDRNPAGKGGI